MADSPATIHVLVLRDVPQTELDRIKAVAPDRIEVTGVWRAMRDELVGWFSEGRVAQFERAPNPVPAPPQEVVDEALSNARVMYTGAVHPSDLVDRMPKLEWAHFTFARLSSIRHSQFWGGDRVAVTYSRGYNGALPIAETALAGGLMLAKGLHTAVRQTDAGAFDVKEYRPWLVADKTIGIVGLGGIGMNLARVAQGMGMRVIGSKHSATRKGTGEGGVGEVYPPGALHEMLGQCDFVALSSPLTRETEGMMDAVAFAAMKSGSIILNVARGEIIDETALIAALKDGHLAGAYLDVYAGDEEGRSAPPELTSLPNVVMTPHTAPHSDPPQMWSLDLFCDNLRRFLDGESLVNVANWERGY